MTITAKDIMHKTTLVSSKMSVKDAAKLMDKKMIGSILCEKEKDVLGILTERDILRKVIAKGLNPDKTDACDIMTPMPMTVDVDTDITKISEIFDKHNIRRLPVTKKGKIVGILTTRDVAKSLAYLYARRQRFLTELPKSRK